LLVAARIEDVKSLGGSMARERLSVSRAGTIADAVVALGKDAFGAIVLAAPLSDDDPFDACAALRAVPACPPILLLDTCERSPEMLDAIPAHARPACRIPRPGDGDSLALRVSEMIEAESSRAAIVGVDDAPQPDAPASVVIAPQAAPASPVVAPRVDQRFAREVVLVRAASSKGSARPPETGSPEPPRLSPDGGKDQKEVDRYFQKARGLIKIDRFEDALASMERVIALRPNEIEYQLYEAWARYLSARAQQLAARAKAEAVARRIIDVDAGAGKPHTILGCLLIDDGDIDGAAREFSLALSITPDDDDAADGLAKARIASPRK
jgi:tetratricopeptide (TPR) repeat protein